MKRLKKIIIMIIIVAVSGLVIENGCLIYFNNYFLVKKASIKSQKVESKVIQKKLFKINGDMSDIKISDDGKFAASSDRKSIKLEDLTNGKTDEIKISEGQKIDCFDWMAYKDQVYFALSSTNDKMLHIFKNYNAINRKIDDEYNVNFIRLDNRYRPESIPETIIDIKNSSSFDGLLIKTLNEKSQGDIWNFNNMEQSLSHGGEKRCARNIIYDPSNVETYFPVNIDNTFIFQVFRNNKVYVSTNVLNTSKAIKSMITLPSDKKVNELNIDIDNPKILFVDEYGKTFIGSVNGGKIAKVYVVPLIGDTAEIKNYNLKAPVEEKNIIFTRNGDAYVVSGSSIVNIVNRKKTKFSGEFIQIADKKIFYKSKGYVYSMEF